MSKQLSVRLYGQPLGLLEQDQDNRMRFTYLPEAQRPLSLGMPVGQKEYDHHHCEAYFGGLLPESEHARKALGKRFGISPFNTFSLLQEIGYDCAGAVSLHEPDASVQPEEGFFLEGRPITDEELVDYIKELPQKPLFIGIDGLRLSLAGAQDKAAICLIDDQVTIPQHGCPTTHILKPAIEQFAETVQNEYFCMRLAKRLGLEVAQVEMRQAKGLPYLLVERYDREVEGDRIRRIHQEDFCQAMGVLTSKKYQNEGGPGLKAGFDLLRETTTPVVDRNRLAQVVVFNYLIGNNDAHGKNFSLLHSPAALFSYGIEGQGYDQAPWGPATRLAPLYDALSTRIYENLTKKMAMKIGSKYEVDYVEPRHWEQLCKEVGYSYRMIKETLFAQMDAILTAAQEEKERLKDSGFDTETVEAITQFLDKQCTRTLKRFQNQ